MELKRVELNSNDKKAILDQARGRILEIEALRRSLERVMALSTACTSILREIPSHGNQKRDKVGTGAIKVALLGDLMNEKLCGMAETLDAAYTIIENVTDSDDRAMLQLHYIEGLTWDEVSNVVKFARETCIRRASAALGETLKLVTECH